MDPPDRALRRRRDAGGQRGVLGRPANDGARNVWYALLDLDGGRAEAELVALDYDWRAQAASIRAAGLPDSFAEAVETGWWTSCLEILPPAERSRGRYQLYRSVLDQLAGTASERVTSALTTTAARPVVPLFGSELFPSRLWVYTNFDCRQLERLAGRPGLSLQTSLDGTEDAHDAQRGRGSWARAMEGVDVARSLGLPVRVGMTETPENAGQGEALRALLAERGVPPEQVAVRPLVARGNSGDGVVVDDVGTVPELTVTADGWYWHPAGADRATSPDLVVGGPELPLVEARRRVVERFLRRRQEDGSLPTIYQCAV